MSDQLWAVMMSSHLLHIVKFVNVSMTLEALLAEVSAAETLSFCLLQPFTAPHRLQDPL